MIKRGIGDGAVFDSSFESYINQRHSNVASSSEFGDSDDESDYKSSDAPGRTNSRKNTSKAPRSIKIRRPKSKWIKLPSKASILVLAHVETDGTEQNALNMDKSVLARIVKALNLANHPGTGEQEAKAALRMANKLMSQHSVTQAAVLATMEDSTEKLKKAGMSTVTVRCDQDKVIKLSTWSLHVQSTMEVLFDCKSYSETFGSKQMNRADFIFYGLAEQTVAAAYAFEMVYNLIMTWRMENKEAKGLSAKNAYCRGIADGIYAYAKEEKRREKQKAEEKEKGRLEAAKRSEEEKRRKRLQRLQQPDEDQKTDVKVKEEEAEIKVEEVIYDNKVLKEEPVDRKVRMEEVEEEPTENSSSGVVPEFSTPPDYPGGGYDPDSDYEDIGHDFSTAPPYDYEARDIMMNNADIGTADFSGEDELTVFDLDRLDAKVKAEEEVTKKPSTPQPLLQPKLDPKQKVKKEETDDSPWESAGQLVAFQESAKVVADEYLRKEKPGLKLKPGRKRPVLVLTDELVRKSYGRGREDAKKIDVKRRRITEMEEDFVD